ncbi:MAG: hypothetical protein LBG23_00445 [Endomicrobium sp.]|jgi:hypothetical protein|nr:hypothetical protein [Endomicrobium sp.]
MKFDKGQSLLEALFVIVFTTVIMFAFLQVCIITVDDIIANEAAFVSARSASVTKSKFRLKEAQDRAKSYILFFYPLAIFSNSKVNPSHFVFVKRNDFQENLSAFSIEDTKDQTWCEDFSDNKNFITFWKGKKKTKDYSGKELCKQTVKIYYFTRVLFGSLVAKGSSIKNRRYQSARNRVIPSPDESYYFKAFPGAKKFEK